MLSRLLWTVMNHLMRFENYFNCFNIGSSYMPLLPLEGVAGTSRDLDVRRFVRSLSIISHTVLKTNRQYRSPSKSRFLSSRTSIKQPPFKRPPSIKRPFFEVPNYFSVSRLQYSIRLLNGQPLLSGKFSKS